MRSFAFAVCLLALLFAGVSAMEVENDFSDVTLEQDVLAEETPYTEDVSFLEEDDDEGDDEDEDEEEEGEEDQEDLQEEDEDEDARNVDVHLYIPMTAQQIATTPATQFPTWPFDKKKKDSHDKDGEDSDKEDGDGKLENGDFVDKDIGKFQSKVAKIVRRLKKERRVLAKKDRELDEKVAGIKSRIASAKREIAELEKEDAASRSADEVAADQKALQDEMRSHPVLSKLYTARKFVIELKRMVRALKTMNPDSPEYASQMQKIQSNLREARDNSCGIKDIDDMINVGATISDIEVEHVRDDEIAGLNAVLSALLRHIQGQINKWEAKIRADHEGELDAASRDRDARLQAARRRLAAAERELAEYRARDMAAHMKGKAELKRIDAELTQLGAIDGHVTRYRRSRITSAVDADKHAAKSELAAADAPAEEEEEW